MEKPKTITTFLEESEIAIFWSIMSDFLPKSLERQALGDEKIFRAFNAMYPNMKNALRGLLLDELLSEGGEDIKQDEIDDHFIDGLIGRANQKMGINQERARWRKIINNKKQQWKQ